MNDEMKLVEYCYMYNLYGRENENINRILKALRNDKL